MIISRTPFRVSFFGGGTDHPNWYDKNDSFVISTTINKYCHIAIRDLPPYFEYKYKLRYFKTEQVNKLCEIKHPVVKEVLKKEKYKKGIELIHYGDIPARSGIGSSSSFTVGFLNAFYALNNYTPTIKELAIKAINLEQNILKENVGSQDQIAAAFGGFNLISFRGKDFKVDPLIIPEANKKKLEESILFCFTGISRNSDKIAKTQIENIKINHNLMYEMNNLTLEALKILNSNSFNIKEFGKLLNLQFNLKNYLNPLASNNLIKKVYKKALELGCYGGKISGAGSGGFLVLIAPKNKHIIIKQKLKNLLFVPLRFDNSGSKIIYYSHNE